LINPLGSSPGLVLLPLLPMKPRGTSGPDEATARPDGSCTSSNSARSEGVRPGNAPRSRSPDSSRARENHHGGVRRAPCEPAELDSRPRVGHVDERRGRGDDRRQRPRRSLSPPIEKRCRVSPLAPPTGDKRGLSAWAVEARRTPTRHTPGTEGSVVDSSPREGERTLSGPASSRRATGYSLKHSPPVVDDAAFCWRPAQTRGPHAAASPSNSASSPRDPGPLRHPPPIGTAHCDGKRPGIRLPPLVSAGSYRPPASRLPPLGQPGSRRQPACQTLRDASNDDLPPGPTKCADRGDARSCTPNDTPDVQSPTGACGDVGGTDTVATKLNERAPDAGAANMPPSLEWLQQVPAHAVDAQAPGYDTEEPRTTATGPVQVRRRSRRNRFDPDSSPCFESSESESEDTDEDDSYTPAVSQEAPQASVEPPGALGPQSSLSQHLQAPDPLCLIPCS